MRQGEFDKTDTYRQKMVYFEETLHNRIVSVCIKIEAHHVNMLIKICDRIHKDE